MLFSFLTSSLLGFLIWLGSFDFTGELEPWDSRGYYYLISLFFTGLFMGIVKPEHPYSAYFGVFFGQIAYGILFLKFGPLFFVGYIFMLVYSLPTIFGAITSAYAKKYLLKLLKK